ncbi:MAG: dephospho-CoA kinase [Pedosphaera sp.]|nr:dephospho-CoA kinase [Pedosphaera sp.]
MKVIGVTGGIGMGKSTSASILSLLGVRVLDTDVIARELVEPGQPALKAIKERFGESIVDDSGRLRRAELGRIIFSDKLARRDLEGILHPLIHEIWLAQVQQWHEFDVTIGAIIIPLLFEISAETQFEAIVCVACTAPIQRQRLVARGLNLHQIESRNLAQWPIERKAATARFVIWTEGMMELHRMQWERVLNAL